MNAELLYLELKRQVQAMLELEQRTVHLIGVHTGGVWIAQRLHAELGIKTPLGLLSSDFHRDDLDSRFRRGNPSGSTAVDIAPRVSKATVIDFDINGADIIVVDDILNTGRTVRAVLNELYDFGRASRIELAVLIDRGGRELPVYARYCGGTHPLPNHQSYVLSMTTAGGFEMRIE
jgi:pyrimidine operon attenuation protein / uracil phosphoribosyltransferase